MSGNIGRLKIKLKQTITAQTNLQVEAKGLCHSIGEILVPELTEIEEMEIAKAAAFVDELMIKQTELLSLQTQIWQLEKALGY